MSALGKMLKIVGLKAARDALLWLASRIVPRSEKAKRAYGRAEEKWADAEIRKEKP